MILIMVTSLLASGCLSIVADGSPSLLEVETSYNTLTMDRNTLHFLHPKGKARVLWGLSLPEGIQPVECHEGDACLNFGVSKLVVTKEDHCQRVTWTTSQLPYLKDCVALEGHWYGGGEQISQPWPIEKVPRMETPFVTADMLQNRDQWYGGVSEAYWVSTQGVAVRVDEDTPLFLSLPDDDGDGDADQMCLKASREMPFSTVDSEQIPLTLSYCLCSGDDVRKVHELTLSKFFSHPRGIPEEKIFEDPIWSTWAEYKEDVSDVRVMEFALGIKSKGFNHSQVEIDDNWETCYGDAVFNPDRFPNPKKLVDKLHSEGFRVTLWIHPFINDNCRSFRVADQKGYFIKDSEGVTQKTSWWQGKSAGLIDFSNPSASTWWTQRLLDLKESTGIDSFKFDAGETSWMPKIYTLEADQKLWPNVYTKKYVEAVVEFGGRIETRVGSGTQTQPVFVRMLDKDSVWSADNGLKTLVPSLLHFGLIGYPFVLPDMIGGNSYVQQPSVELFLRWAQANAFMPALQFSILPWHYGDFVTEECKKVTSLHKEMAPLIIKLAREAVETGVPMMRPTWWLCPEVESCQTADQQFLVGDQLLVTPVVHEGASSLNVVIPPGRWRRADSGRFYYGPSVVTLDDITLESLIYFTREMEKEL